MSVLGGLGWGLRVVQVFEPISWGALGQGRGQPCNLSVCLPTTPQPSLGTAWWEEEPLISWGRGRI